MSGRLIRYAILTLSDRSALEERADASGPKVREMLEHKLRGQCVAAMVLADEQELIEKELVRLCDEDHCTLIVTTGGTGLGPRDITPEATRAVIDREIPGLAEAMRIGGLAHTPMAMLSRAVCGQRGQAIIVNLSGSPRAVREQLEVILPVLPHALSAASGQSQDCAR